MLFLNLHFDSDLGMSDGNLAWLGLMFAKKVQQHFHELFFENWDIFFLVVVIGGILGWAIYVTILGPFMP